MHIQNPAIFRILAYLEPKIYSELRSPFLLFTQDYFSEHFHNHTSLFLINAWNLPYYWHFDFCLYGWSNSNVPLTLIHLNIRAFSEDHFCNIESLKGGDLEALNYWGDLIWKGEDLRSLFIPCWLISLTAMKAAFQLSFLI